MIMNTLNLTSFDAERFALSNYVFNLTATFRREEYSLIKVVGAGQNQLPATTTGSDDFDQ